MNTIEGGLYAYILVLDLLWYLFRYDSHLNGCSLVNLHLDFLSHFELVH